MGSDSTAKGAPSQLESCAVSYPRQGVVLVTITRPKSLNSLTLKASDELDSVFQWFDQERSLKVAIITGEGKAFCVGADLKEWMKNNADGVRMRLPENGFAGLSFRQGKKPVIAAVNGPAYGGGCEAAVNCDLIVASSDATFALPEVKRGLTPFGGALPRIMRVAGKQRASEMALTGRAVSAHEFQQWGLCNAVCEKGEDVVQKALHYATAIAENSPDSVIITREGLKLGWEALGVSDASRIFFEGWSARIHDGDNMQEGLNAFVEKRPVQWIDSKL